MVVFLVETATNTLNLLQNMGWLGRTWRGWTIKLALIALPFFLYLSDELSMAFCWYLCNLQPCILNPDVGQHNPKNTQVCSKTLVGRVEYGEVGQEKDPLFPPQDECIFLMNFNECLLASVSSTTIQSCIFGRISHKNM